MITHITPILRFRSMARLAAVERHRTIDLAVALAPPSTTHRAGRTTAGVECGRQPAFDAGSPSKSISRDRGVRAGPAERAGSARQRAGGRSDSCIGVSLGYLRFPPGKFRLPRHQRRTPSWRLTGGPRCRPGRLWTKSGRDTRGAKAQGMASALGDQDRLANRESRAEAGRRGLARAGSVHEPVHAP